ncbi:hypothetical protein AAFF_G00435610 [Aldrovandia affinis]|uniref:Uncharacterized protein n=1 Tax=Aldrovandia affinis TaxID=143900 RepID=A0AAD7WI68_9TELE|nr:hypothetical protein AAFF_G00435610 [Aldrovandia affinis]
MAEEKLNREKMEAAWAALNEKLKKLEETEGHADLRSVRVVGRRLVLQEGQDLKHLQLIQQPLYFLILVTELPRPLPLSSNNSMESLGLSFSDLPEVATGDRSGEVAARARPHRGEGTQAGAIARPPLVGQASSYYCNRDLPLVHARPSSVKPHAVFEIAFRFKVQGCADGQDLSTQAASQSRPQK